MKIKRYDIYGKEEEYPQLYGVQEEEDDTGKWVKYEDVKELIEPSGSLHPVIQRRSEAHLCPICNGHGFVSEGFYNPWFVGTDNPKGGETCRSCNGTGIVWSKIEPIE